MELGSRLSVMSVLILSPKENSLLLLFILQFCVDFFFYSHTKSRVGFSVFDGVDLQELHKLLGLVMSI